MYMRKTRAVVDQPIRVKVWQLAAAENGSHYAEVNSFHRRPNLFDQREDNCIASFSKRRASWILNISIVDELCASELYLKVVLS